MTFSLKALHQQASQLVKLKNHAQASVIYESILNQSSEDLIALINLGTYRIQSGQLEVGLALIESALKVEPNNLFALGSKAIGLKLQKKYEEALLCYQLAIDVDPSCDDTWVKQGHLLRAMNRAEEALHSYDKALIIKPDSLRVLNFKAVLLKELERFNEALFILKKAIDLNDKFAITWFNLANLHVQLNSIKAALNCFSKAIEINSNYIEAYNNRSNIFKSLNYVDEAQSDCTRAISINPSYVEAQWNLSLLHLLRGDFKQGWELYEWRWKRPDRNIHPRYINEMRWMRDANISDKKIVLHSEQGFGDTIQFCRYAILITKLGGSVYFDVPPQLRRLLKSLGQHVHLLSDQPPSFKFHLHSPMMSLPWLFKTDLDTIPMVGGFLSASARDIADWSSQLGNKQKIRVGLSWAGNPLHSNDHRRSIKLCQLKSILDLDYDFYVLQKDIPSQDMAFLTETKNLKCFNNRINDFADTAALISNLDLVITIDSAVAHLSGALGCPTWIMLPYAPDFRWMLNRDDSPWYKSVQLFRQPSLDNWDALILKVRKALEHLN